jgi:hypothetical protein
MLFNILSRYKDWRRLTGLLIVIGVIVFTVRWGYSQALAYLEEVNTGAPPYGEALEEVPAYDDPRAQFINWKRPEGPPKIGLQVGHLNSSEAPDELARLRANTGTSGGGKWEYEINNEIAQKTAKLLETRGIVVDILPATVPVDYWADAFIAIHADGNLDRTVSGYKVAPPWRDWTGKADELSSLIEKSYGFSTGLPVDPNISRNMRGYYAFSWWRYEHAIHEMTPGVIVETGFLTNASDQKIIIHNQDLAAQGIASGIIEYLKKENLLN